MEKFKSNPYNSSNKLVSENDILNIMKTLNIKDFKINNLSLYQISFIHKSYCHMADYEEYENIKNDLPLYERFYKIYGENEGFLTKIRTRIVCGENLAKLSNELNFNKHLIISKHIEDNCNGRNNKNILEDVFEAFIGAIYLDNNYEFVEKIIIKIIEELVDFTDIIINDTNYKDQILKYCQHNFKSYPTYSHVRKDEDIFYCNLSVNEITITGEGKTKKKAEQDASKKTLQYFKVL